MRSAPAIEPRRCRGPQVVDYLAIVALDEGIAPPGLPTPAAEHRHA
jgi:hypothetical protein